MLDPAWLATFLVSLDYPSADVSAAISESTGLSRDEAERVVECAVSAQAIRDAQERRLLDEYARITEHAGLTGVRDVDADGQM